MTSVLEQATETKAEPAGRSHGRSVWALADQVLISGTNFITMVLAARLGKEQFGDFSLVHGALLFVNIFQFTLITQPHNVLGTVRHGADYRRYTTSIALGQIFIILIVAVLGLLAAGVARAAGWPVSILLLAVVPAMIGWQSQEFVRRVMYTESRFRAAFANDCVAYGGQILVMAALFRFHHLTNTRVFYCIGGASLIAAMVGLWRLRGSFSRQWNAADLWANWRFGKWLTGAEVLSYWSSLYLYMYLVAIVLGTATSAVLRSSQVIFGPTRILSLYLGNVLPIRFTHALASDGPAAMHGELKRVYLRVIPLLGLYCLAVAVFSGTVLRVVFGKDYADSGAALALFTIPAFLGYMQMVITAALTARHQTRLVLIGYVWGTVVALALSWFLLKIFGVEGAIVCMIVSAVITNIFFWRAYLRQKPLAAATPQESAAADAAGNELAAHPGRGRFLSDVAAMLDRRQIPWCVLHGYQGHPAWPGDVDCLMPADAVPGPLARTFQEEQPALGGRIVQWLDDEAHYVVLARQNGDGACLLPLHISSDYELDGRVFYRGEEVLQSRRQHADLWVPDPAIEFACILINRILKEKLTEKHTRQLVALYARDPAGCEAQAHHLWDGDYAELLIGAVRSDSWEEVLQKMPQLRADLRSTPRGRGTGRGLAVWWGRQVSRLGRWLRPRWGLHVVFMGPDGVGKSTIIEAVKRDLSPAFLGTQYGTFAPGLLPSTNNKPKAGPHSLPPRSLPASLVKAAWWLVCYTAGYALSTRIGKARGQLVINHRYFIDATVDPYRYRYSGPIWLLRWIWRVVPKPDLIILLDAPAEVVRARKQELPMEEVVRQREGYRALAAQIPQARLIDASQPLEQTIASVEKVILDHLAARAARRLGLEVRP